MKKTLPAGRLWHRLRQGSLTRSSKEFLRIRKDRACENGVKTTGRHRLFASITVGLQVIDLKIADMTSLKVLEDVSADVTIGADIYNHDMIAFRTVDQACRALAGFVRIMKDYGVDEYRAVAASSVQEAANAAYVKEQIRIKTGLNLEWLSNAEERYLHNQAVSYKTEGFSKLIEEGTMLIDIGSGSMQLTVYNNGQFIFSRNIKLGPLRIREMLGNLEGQTGNYVDIMEDYIMSKINGYQQFAPKNVRYEHFVLVGTDLLAFKRAFLKTSSDKINRERFNELYRHILNMPVQVLARQYRVPYDSANQLLPSAMILKIMLEMTGAKSILLSEADLADGLLIHNELEHNKRRFNHSFTEDIIGSARNIAARYNCDAQHIATVEKFALHLFDRLKPLHGLDKRCRLLLQLAAILQDAGSFIDMNAHYIHSYYIIQSSEIIGVSDRERDIIACIARYHSVETPVKGSAAFSILDPDSRLIVAKLAAILRLADALDDSRQQKVRRITVSLKHDQVVITAAAEDDLSLEHLTFGEKSGYFEEVYGLKPILKG
ncbi:exopolyphosphatase [Sporolactobacillus sp. Y61]|jgi:exopolyphosphatase/guanosine-5'-triphosphate,3'-diphosphate pyrophosphatase|uniref:Exopolyphosphatase n=1 Tax=Sporolactobacillus sp. Y61 TaxID=3160863 RepID=A0AAU8IBZ5_9BACL|nr:exopolyphosphatase [Sporolactobacillus sp. THM19-2]RYL93556.1 exopolyphosphatase [Sporolactobacillus sp. THM19-2]